MPVGTIGGGVGIKGGDTFQIHHTLSLWHLHITLNETLAATYSLQIVSPKHPAEPRQA